MAAGKYSFTIEQGTTHKFTVEYKDSNSIPISLSGYSGRMQIRSDFADNSNTLYLTLSSSLDNDGSGLNFNGLEGTTPLSSGSIGVYISSTKTAALNFDEAYYDLEIYSGSEAIRILEGNVILDREVTRV